MLLPLHHLRRQIIQRPAQRRPSIARSVHAPPKVPNLQFSINTQQQILGLDIAVDDMLPVQINERVGHLVDIPRAPFLGETSMLRELAIQLPLPRELQHQKDAFLIMEVSVQPQHVRMAQVLLDLDFPADLLFDARGDDLGFVEAFEGEDVVGGGFGAHHVDPTEFAFAQGPTDVEVGEVPFAGGAEAA